MPAMNLPGLSTPALPAAVTSSPSVAARDIGQSGAETTPVTSSERATDTPAASFGQHLRQARGKASSGGRSTDADQASTARNASGSSRQAAGAGGSETGSGSWPSTIHTASMAGGRWKGRGALAGSQADGNDPRATALLETALQKTTAKEVAAGDTRAGMSDRTGTPPTLDLKAIAGLLAAADPESALPPSARADVGLEASITRSTAAADVTPVSRAGEAELSLAAPAGAEDVIGDANCHSAALTPEANGTDAPVDSLTPPDVRAALAANTTAWAKGKALEDKSATPATADDTATSVLVLDDDQVEPADEKKAAATDDLVDPNAVAVEAAVVIPLPQTPNATPTVQPPLDTAAADTRPDVVNPTETAQGDNRATADAQTLAAANNIATTAEPAAKQTDAAADDGADQSLHQTDGQTEEPSATAAATHTTTAQTPAAVTPSHNTQQVNPATPVNAQPDASLTRVQDIASAAPQASVTPVYDGTIDPAIDTAAFAPALGARIAVLARDGVEQARLNVHPADMGPISVQLSLDGTQVRVDFSAEIAGTRQTLEEAMPSLAASLRDAGFTLSGGGVSQQSAQNGGSSDGNAAANNASSATRGGTAGEDTGNTGANTAQNRSGREAGLVDVFA